MDPVHDLRLIAEYGLNASNYSIDSLNAFTEARPSHLEVESIYKSDSSRKLM